MFDVGAQIEAFFREVAAGRVEIYNEFSLQHELGIFLRAVCGGGTRVQFERPVGFFSFDRSGFVKKEIDICVVAPDALKRVAIELKFPRSGQHPEQMFSFCKDIAFVEQIVQAGFTEGFFVAVADDPLFYSGSAEGIYGYFRGGIPIHGAIQKPTGKRDETVTVCGSYAVTWQDAGHVKYACIPVPPL